MPTRRQTTVEFEGASIRIAAFTLKEVDEHIDLGNTLASAKDAPEFPKRWMEYTAGEIARAMNLTGDIPDPQWDYAAVLKEFDPVFLQHAFVKLREFNRIVSKGEAVAAAASTTSAAA